MRRILTGGIAAAMLLVVSPDGADAQTPAPPVPAQVTPPPVPQTAPLRKARRATKRQLGRYTTLRHRVIRQIGRRKAGHNLHRGIRRCFLVQGSNTRECQMTRPRRRELHRRVKLYRRILARHAATRGPGWPAWVAAAFALIRQCESHNNPQAVGQGPAAGHYGLYQFDLPTYASVGGRGNPINDSRAEQDKRAYILWQRRGFAPWACASIVGVR